MPTPDYIKQAASQALADGYTYYPRTAASRLRAKIAEKTAALHGVQLDPDAEIVVTASGTQALNVGIRCAIDPGTEAIVLTPNWPNGAEIVRMFGATPVEVPFAYDGKRFSVDMDAVAAALTDKTRLLLYTSPSNPLGWVATQAEQQALLTSAGGMVCGCGRRGLRAALLPGRGRSVDLAPVHATMR